MGIHFNTRDNKGDLLILICGKLNSDMLLNEDEDQKIQNTKCVQSGQGKVSFYKRMITKWFMKPIVENIGDSRENNLEN